MVGDSGATVASVVLDGRSFGVGRIGRGFDSGSSPEVEFHDTGVGFEPISEFVFGSKHGPVWWKGEVGHVTVLDGIMRYKGLFV